MNTEEIQRTQRSRDPYEVSRALQELKPLSCRIVDRHGRPVPLSSAGYLLSYGQSYRLQIMSSFADDEIQEVRIINAPPFVNVEPALREVDGQGRTVRSVPFKVALDLWSHVRKLGVGVSADELDVVHYFKPGILREASRFSCPIVARMRWGAVLAAVLLGLLLLLLQNLLAGLISADQSLDVNFHAFLARWMRWDLWLALLGVALLIWSAVRVVNLLLLYRRSRQLRNDFREKYCA